MTRNAKVGEYIIVNATEMLGYWCSEMEYLINNKEAHEVLGLFSDGDVRIKGGWTINRKDYTLVEDTIVNTPLQAHCNNATNPRPFDYSGVEDTMKEDKKAEEIDLKKSAVFDEPLKGYRFWDADCQVHDKSEGFLESIHMTKDEPYVNEGGTTWQYCEKIPVIVAKMKPMTSLQVFQLMPIDTVLWQEINDTTYIFTEWSTCNTIKDYKYTIIDQAFKDLKNIDDIEWMKMEVKE